MKRMNQKNESGFTLLEIMIAMAIFAIGILAVGKMQISAIQGNAFSNSLTGATTLAQDRMETLMGLSYTDPLNSDTDGDGTNQDIDDDGIDDDGGNFGLDDTNTAADHSDGNNPVYGRYNVYWNIAVDHPTDNTKTIRVIVVWTENGNQKTVTLTSRKMDII